MVKFFEDSSKILSVRQIVSIVTNDKNHAKYIWEMMSLPKNYNGDLKILLWVFSTLVALSWK